MRIFTHPNDMDPKAEALRARLGALDGVEIQIVDSARPNMPVRAHSPTYVYETLTHGDDEAPFDYTHLRSLGAVIAATHYTAITGKSSVAIARSGATSGFDEYVDPSEPFNALVVAATVALENGHDEVAILSGDDNEGHGVDSCLQQRKLAARMSYYAMGRWFKTESAYKVMCSGLTHLVMSLADRCKVLIYSAGVAPAYGNQDIELRDRHVLEAAQALKLGVVILTGDGLDTARSYDLHTHTAQAAAKFLDN